MNTAAAMPSEGEVSIKGSGNDAIGDVRLVQEAVNRGGTVFLEGPFLFTGAESGPTSKRRCVTIRNSVRILIAVDSLAPTIIGGERPFLIEAPGASVTFDGIRFQDSKRVVINSDSVADLIVRNCSFSGVIPMDLTLEETVIKFAAAITGKASNTMQILGNQIEIGNETIGLKKIVSSTNGISLSGPLRSLEISGNQIKRTTAHGINLQDIGGDVTVKGNDITTGQVGRGGGVKNFVDGIRCLGPGNYSILDNTNLDMGFENGAAIRLGGTSQATVSGNTINMTMLLDKTPGEWSAGIQVQGTAVRNNIEGNIITGRAGSALSVVFSDFEKDKGAGDGVPRSNVLRQNDHEQFDATHADIEILKAVDTHIVTGPDVVGTIIDEGADTSIEGGTYSPP